MQPTLHHDQPSHRQAAGDLLWTKASISALPTDGPWMDGLDGWMDGSGNGGNGEPQLPEFMEESLPETSSNSHLKMGDFPWKFGESEHWKTHPFFRCELFSCREGNPTYHMHYVTLISLCVNYWLNPQISGGVTVDVGVRNLGELTKGELTHPERELPKYVLEKITTCLPHFSIRSKYLQRDGWTFRKKNGLRKATLKVWYGG